MYSENSNGFAEGYAIGRDSGNGNGTAWGGDAWWIIILLIFGWFGGNNGFGGFGGFGSGSGAMENYVLGSDFSMLSRQLSDGFSSQERKLDSISNGICSLGYDQLAQMNGINQNIASSSYNTLNAITTSGYESRLATQNLSQQLADCCCRTQQNIKDVETQNAFNTNTITSAIKDCCCDTERQYMQSRFDAQQYNCATLQAIDKVGDRIIDYLAQDKAQALRDENQALRLAASQQAQNNYLVNQLRPCPVPAYITCNPYSYQQASGCNC